MFLSSIELILADIEMIDKRLEKARKNALFKTARTEVLVTEPTKTNVEINHELLNTKTIPTRISTSNVQSNISQQKGGKD